MDFDSWAAKALADPSTSGYTLPELRDIWDAHYGGSAAPAAKGKKPGLMSDAGNLMLLGVDSMASGVRWGAGKLFGEDAVSAIDSAGTALGMPTVDQLQKRHEAGLSPEMRSAMQKEFITEDESKDGLDKYGLGPAWSDPRSYFAAIVQSIPGTIATMGPSMTIAKMVGSKAIERALASGASKEAAKALGNQAAERAATIAGGVLEGGQQGASSGAEVESSILDPKKITRETLDQSEFFRDMMASGMTEAEARKELASSAGIKAAFLAGVTTGIFGGQGDKILARAFGKGLTGGTLKRAGKVAAGESTEEFGQGLTSKMAENYATQQADPSRPIMQGALNEAVTGTVAGAGVGAPLGAFSRSITPGSAAEADVLAGQARDAISEAKAKQVLEKDAAQARDTEQRTQGVMNATSMDEIIAAATAPSKLNPLGGDINTPAYMRAGVDLPLGGAEVPSQAATPAQEALDAPTQGSTPERAGQAFLSTLARVSPKSFDSLVSAVAQATGARDLPGLGAAIMERAKDRAFWNQIAQTTGKETGTIATAAYQAMQSAAKQAPELQAALIHLKDIARIAASSAPTTDAKGSVRDVPFANQDEAQRAASLAGRTDQAVETPQGTRLQDSGLDGATRAVEALKASIMGDASSSSAEGSTVSQKAAKTAASLHAVSDAKLPGIALARAFAQKLGRRVVVVDSDGDAAPFNGAVVGTGAEGDAKGVLFIHAKTKRPAMAVIGHELLHTLSPELRAMLAKALSPMIGESKIKQKMEAFGLSREAAIEELVADIVGNRFMEASFWKFLEKKNPSLFREFASRAIELLDRIIEAMRTGLGLFGADEGLSTSQLRRARVTIANVLAEHAKSLTPQQQKQLGWNGVTGGFAANHIPIAIGRGDDKQANVVGRVEHPVEEPKRIGYEPGARGQQPIAMGDGRSKDEPPAKVVGRAPVETNDFAPAPPKQLTYEPGNRGGETIRMGRDVEDEPAARKIGRVDVGEVNTNPSDAQKEAGNYQKGHISYDGNDITIENPIGSERSGKDSKGKPWSVEMSAHYGYIKRTEGADGEQIDVYLVDRPAPGAPVFVFDQYHPNGRFDEHKVVMGVATRRQAEEVYDSHFSDGTGPRRRQGMKQMSMLEFKEWIKNGDTSKAITRKGGTTYSTESDGDGAGRQGAGGEASRALPAPEQAAPLEGAPQVRGATGPDAGIVKVAEQYAKSRGIKLTRQSRYAEVDEDRARRIADAYAAMEHAPQDPAVREAYQDLIEQTTAQYRALEAAGYKFWLIDISSPAGQEYASTPWNAMRDIRANKRMGVFPTEEGFGSGDTELNVDDNPLLADTGIEWPFGSPDGRLKRVLANDLFRAVHDAMGHGIEGAGFRAQGEENAWQAHARLFTGPAVGAMTSETRGQNSWLNYGPHGEANRNAKTEDTIFADQKTGLMPEWTWREGVQFSGEPSGLRRAAQYVTDTIADLTDEAKSIIGLSDLDAQQNLVRSMDRDSKAGRLNAFQKIVAGMDREYEREVQRWFKTNPPLVGDRAHNVYVKPGRHVYVWEGVPSNPMNPRPLAKIGDGDEIIPLYDRSVWPEGITDEAILSASRRMIGDWMHVIPADAADAKFSAEPQWWRDGRKVEATDEALEAASGDAPFQLDAADYESEWRIAVVPLVEINDLVGPDESESATRDRIASIKDAPRLFRPILELSDKRGVSIIDGWHRLQLAKERGQKTIEALVGKPKAFTRFSAESSTGIELTKLQHRASLEQDLYSDFSLSGEKFANQAQFGEFLNRRLGKDHFAGNYGPQALRHVSGVFAHEGILAIKEKKNGGQWYRDSVEEAMKQAARIYPEIADGGDDRFLFSIALAITSNGQTIADNVNLAFEAYADWRKKGRFTKFITGAGDRTSTINGSLQTFNGMVDRAGSVATLRNFLLTKRTVREIEDSLEMDVNGENRDSIVYGGAVLGPKVGGGFLPNLNGLYDALTIDRWLTRTYNRIVGNMLASNGEIQNGPRNGSERQFLRDAFASAIEQMKAQGFPVEQADLQALLWYPEKDLYAQYGVSDIKAAPTDYAIEVKKYADQATKGSRPRRDRNTAAGAKSGRGRGTASAMEIAEQRANQHALFSAEGAAEAAASVTETPEFKRWFGDSKVVDEQGKPLVVYHGTAHDLVGGAFNAGMAKSEGGGFYFSHSPLMKNPASNANEYAAGRAGDSPNVMPVYLSMKNPLVKGFTEPMPEGDEAITAWLGRMEKFNRGIDWTKERYYKQAIREARAGGHDGVIIRNVEDVPNDAGRRFTNEADVYIALEPNQIKSAIGNNGTFDATNPDIRFSSEMENFIDQFDDYEVDVSDPFQLDRSGDEDLDAKAVKPTAADKHAARRWLELAKDQRLFLHKDVDDKELENIAYDIGKLRSTGWAPAKPVERGYGATRVARIAMPKRNGESVDAIVMRDDSGHVWIDVASLRRGAQEGSMIYPIVATYAHNNGLTFIGDPSGLSDDAVFRRTEHMLATALKYGTTYHIQPHERQLRAGLSWKTGDTEYNIASMIAWSRKQVMDAVPALADVAVDMTAGRVEDSEGNFMDNDALDALLSVGGGRDARAGVRTAKRTLVTNEFLNEYARGEQDGSEDLPPALRGTSYSVEPPGFYSQLRNAFDMAPNRPMSGKQWGLWLDSNKGKLGVKSDEIEWTGLREYLDMRGDEKLARDDVAAFLRDNGVRVQEVVLPETIGGFTAEDQRQLDLLEMLGSRRDEEQEAEFQRLVGLENDNNDAPGTPSLAKFTNSQWRVPGGENYREVLLTLPGAGDVLSPAENRRLAYLERAYGDEEDNGILGSDLKKELAELRAKKKPNEQFKSSHWDQDNVLLHMRVDDRTDADGKRVLFINELQSDWGQQGRDRGFHEVTAAEISAMEDALQALTIRKRELVARDKAAGLEQIADDTERVIAQESELQGKLVGARTTAAAGVPRGPFVTKTESWVSLGIKRAITMAVQQGYDRVAFATGQQAADYFDLSRDIDSISWTTYPELGEERTSVTIWPVVGNSMQVVVNTAGVVTGTSTMPEAVGKKLSDVIGKDVADKILAHNNELDEGDLKGDGLKIGGEGMKAFYDKIVPQVANDVLKKIGGGRVQYVAFKNEKQWSERQLAEMEANGADVEDAENMGIEPNTVDMSKQPGFDITPAMKEKVGTQGVPLFSGEPEWVSNGSAALKSAASKIDTYAPAVPMQDKAKAMWTHWKDRWLQGMVDSFAPLRKLDQKAYIAARMVKSADGVLEGTLMHGRPMVGADGGIVGDIDHKGFLGVMKELQGEHDRFFMWLAGNRAARLIGEDREHLFSADEIAAMKELNRGKMPDGTSRETAYAKALNDFVGYNKAVMDIAQAKGLIDGESRHLWEHDFYVPFYRVSDDDTLKGPTQIKGLVRQQAFKKLKGGKENLGDLMENTLRNWSNLLSASLANEAAGLALNAAQDMGVAVEATSHAAQEMAKAMGIKGGATYYMDGGKQRWFVVEDPMLMDAITAMEAVPMKGLPMQLMGKFKKYLTLGTTISPAFKMRNLMRDTVAAIGTNDMSYNMAANLMQGWAATDTKGDDYAQMLFGGALMRFGTFVEGDRASHVKQLIKNGVDDGTILDTQDKIKGAFSKLWDQWQDFGDRMENVNRAALYRQLLDSGMTPREAAFKARDMMDFSLTGSWVGMRMLTQVVPFLNARVQGLYKLGRAGAQDPKRLATVLGGIVMASWALMLAYQDDEDWKQREDWDRDNFWWIKIGDVAYRIPKPFEMGAVGTIAERSLELAINDEMTGKRFAERMRSIIHDQLQFNPVPQAFKPLIDLYANEDSFTGRQIETRGMERLSKAERAGPNTSALGKMLGAAGNITGLSPVQIDHLVRAYTGWMGAQVLNITNVMALPFGETPAPMPKWDDYTGGFVKALPASGSRYLEEFYKTSKAIHEVMGDIKAAREAHDYEKAREIETSEAWKVRASKLYSHAERNIGKINTQIREARNSRDMDSETKRARIEELTQRKNALAKVIDRQTRLLQIAE